MDSKKLFYNSSRFCHAFYLFMCSKSTNNNSGKYIYAQRMLVIWLIFANREQKVHTLYEWMRIIMIQMII